MLRSIGWIVGLMLVQAGQAPPPTATDVTNAAITDVIKGMATQPTADVVMRVSDVGNGRVGISLVRRAQPDQNSLTHLKVTEIYIIKEGSGTFVTGGTLKDPQPPTNLAAVGPTVRGGTIEGGTSRRMGPGDMIIIPPNVPHGFSQLDSPIVYAVIRVDPEKVLATK